MELFVALAAVIVAAATLFLAYAARRRFAAYDARLNQTDRNVDSLTSEQRELKAAAAANVPADDVKQVQKAVQDLAERHETQKKTQAEDVTKVVGQLGREVTTAFKEHTARLDSLARRAADHDLRLNSLDQLAVEHEARFASLDQLASDVARSLRDLSADAVQLRKEAGEQAAALRALNDRTRTASKQTAETLSGLGDQLLALAADVELLDLDRRELRTQLRKWLAHSAQQTRMAPAIHVMPGFIQAERRAASHILPSLYEAFLESANLDFVYRERAGTAGVFYYLLSRLPDDRATEQKLGRLLTACQVSDPDAGLLGLTELRSLLLAMYAGGPGAIRLGPLIVSHTTGSMFRAAVLTVAEAQTLEVGDLSSSAIRCTTLLDESPEDRVLDLAAWAASNS
jgi:hypothetical protein